MYKTQVLVAQTNDHHRTRLTHTLEVAQISRTIARQLGLNEDLTEAIALSHDLGHPPFGHAGEWALDECMAGAGRLRTQPARAANRRGPGISLRRFSRPEPVAGGPGGDGPPQRASRAPEVAAYLTPVGPLLEAQVVDAADSLAYDTHDVDDAFGIGLLQADDLEHVEFWRQAVARVDRRRGRLGPPHLEPAVVRELIDWQVTDLLEHSRQRLRQANIRSVADVRGPGRADRAWSGGPAPENRA